MGGPRTTLTCKKKKKKIYIYIYTYAKKNYINYYIKFNMFYDHLDLKKMNVRICVYIYIYIYIYTLLKNILYTKLTNFDHLNKNVEQLYLRIIRI